jgi:hypothetical protein
MNQLFSTRQCRLFSGQVIATAVLGLSHVAGVSAQAAKTIAIEPVPVMQEWVNRVALTFTEVVTSFSAPNAIALFAQPAGASRPLAFQPKPVILGVPELPLVGSMPAGQAIAWAESLNYQGMHVKLLVLDATGTRLSLRPLNMGVAAGERFKIRITPTFDSVAQVDKLLGDAWNLSKVGQIYPRDGFSVEIRNGETAVLPLGDNEFFAVADPRLERLVLSVRHPRATGNAVSNQPAYRQDGNTGSNYLQLQPVGKLPAIEQHLVAR